MARLYFHRMDVWMRASISKNADLIISLVGGRDWIRIAQDGRYSHRIYRNGIGAMSYGICETSD